MLLTLVSLKVVEQTRYFFYASGDLGLKVLPSTFIQPGFVCKIIA